MAIDEIDATRVEEFAGRLVGIMNDAMLALMFSIGHRTGLFDTMATLEPTDSQGVADAAGLNERYVREWLGAMVTGGVVEHDAAAGTYKLPPEHAAMVTRAAGPNNLATLGQYVSLLGDVEDGIVNAFREGGGVPYSEYPKFQKLMAEESAQVFDATLIDVTLPLVPGLVARLEEGIDVADLGCGQGHAINLMAKAFPNSRFTGFDFSEEGVAAGAAEAKELGLTNASFEVKDAATFGGPPAYDFITTFDSIHDQRDPARVLQGISDALRSDGTYLCVDIQASSHLHENVEHPLGPFLYTVSTMHCMTVSLALDGEGLGTVWGEQKAREMMQAAGFTNIDVHRVEGDIVNNYYVATKG